MMEKLSKQNMKWEILLILGGLNFLFFSFTNFNSGLDYGIIASSIIFGIYNLYKLGKRANILVQMLIFALVSLSIFNHLYILNVALGFSDVFLMVFSNEKILAFFHKFDKKEVVGHLYS